MFSFRKFAISAGQIIKLRLFILLLASFITSIALAEPVKRWAGDFGEEGNELERNSGFMIAAYNEWHFLGLKPGDSVFVRFSNYYSENNLPLPKTGFMAISAGNERGLGLCDQWFILTGGLKEDCRAGIRDLDFFTDNQLSPCDFGTFAILVGDWLLDCGAEPPTPVYVPE